MIPDRGMRYSKQTRRPLPPPASQQDVLGGVDLGREVRRPPLVGVKFLHQRPVRVGDVIRRSRPATGQGPDKPALPSFCRSAQRPPRCRVTLRVLTPAGLPAVKISGQ